MLTVKPKTEELLYLLLWTCDMLSRPTFRNLTDSFESWAYRNGFNRRLAALERHGLVESRSDEHTDLGPTPLVRRLTEAGRLHALGGRDPEVCWARPWDGRWHLVLFDLPAAEGTARNRLRNVLRERGFGWLQNSVWVSPHSLAERELLRAGVHTNVESILFLEARPSAGETDEEIVAGAWDFEAINRGYARHQRVLEAHPATAFRNAADADVFRKWAEKERTAWLDAVRADPLLPERLWPTDYLGQVAWCRRLKTLRETSARLRSYHPR